MREFWEKILVFRKDYILIGHSPVLIDLYLPEYSISHGEAYHSFCTAVFYGSVFPFTIRLRQLVASLLVSQLDHDARKNRQGIRGLSFSKEHRSGTGARPFPRSCISR